jgi:hypothetical protein
VVDGCKFARRFDFLPTLFEVGIAIMIRSSAKFP